MVKLVLLSLCLLAVYVNAEKIVQCDLGNGQIIKVGDEQPEVGTCNIVSCHEDGSMSAKTCAAFQVLPPCTREKGDPNKLYPGCCDFPKCPGD